MALDASTLAAVKVRDALRKAREQGDCTGYSTQRGKVAPCKRYKLWVTTELCRRCVADPEFKQSLFARLLGEHKERACANRGQDRGTRQYGCCGGRKKFVATAFRCKTRGLIDETRCWACEGYTP